MKHIRFGDITTVTHGIIVHGCNAQGAMGAGVAYQIKNLWPKAFEDYAHFISCVRENNLSPGCTLLTKDQALAFRQGVMGRVINTVISDKLVISNAITQFDYSNSGTKHTSYQAVYDSFEHILDLARETRLPVHYPLIGAGLGGGNWAIISEIIDTMFQHDNDIQRTLWLFD